MLSPQSIPPPYVVVTTLGAGGMATVYLVRDEHHGTLHALKVAHLPDRATRRRFLDEAGVLARLRHPNVVAITGVINLGDGMPGLLLEYVAGPSLARLLAARRLTFEDVDVLARPMLRGLAAAHDAGVVHRDLKPSNVLLAAEGGALSPKLTDFGIAADLAVSWASRATLTGALLGTPHYMPPEQFDDPRLADARSDVFAIGACLYEMLTGRRAFDGSGPMQVMSRIQAGQLTPIGELVADLPLRMERAVTTALAFHPEQRWLSARELLTAWLGAGDAADPVPSEALVAAIAGLRTSTTNDLEPLDHQGDAWLNTAAAAGTARVVSSGAGVGRSPSWRWRVMGAIALAAVVVLIWRWFEAPSSRPADEVQQATFTRVTFNKAEDQILGAALSADGRKVVTSERSGVFVREALPGPATALHLPEGMHPGGSVAWCGEEIALGLTGPDEASSSDLWSGVPPAGPWRKVLAGAEVRTCSWDGTRLVAVDESRLLVVERATGQALQVADLSGGYVAQAAFSPDGAHIAYTWTDGERSSAMIVSAQGSSPPRTLRADVLPHGLAWSAEGEVLLLKAREREQDDRWATLVKQRVSANGELGPERVLAPRVGPAAEGLSVSRNGDRLTYLTVSRQRSVYTGTPTGADAHRLTTDGAPAFANGWVDDATLAYSTAAQGSLDVFVRSLSASDASPLFATDRDEYGATSVPGSPDWIFERRVADQDEIELVWARPDGETVLWSGRGTDYLARRRTRCVAGPACFFGVSDAQGLALSRVTPTGLRPIMHLPTVPWRPVGWDVSPAADRVAWSGARGLEIRRFDGSEARVIELDGALQEVVWGPGGDWIIATMLNVSGHTYAIVRIDVHDGALTVLKPDLAWPSHLTLSPTARWLAWTRTEYDIVVWLADLPGGE